MSCINILGVLNCDSHFQFSKSQLSSPTVYLSHFWELPDSISNNIDITFSTSTSEIVIGLTRIPNLYLDLGNHLVQSFSSPIVLTSPTVTGNRNTQHLGKLLLDSSYSPIKPFKYFTLE